MNVITNLINATIEKKPIKPKAVAAMCGNDDLTKIWQTVQTGSYVAREIKFITGIPQTTLYRELTWLLDNGIIGGKFETIMNKKQRQVRFYSVIQSFSSTINKHGQNITIKLFGNDKPIKLVVMSRIKTKI